MLQETSIKVNGKDTPENADVIYTRDTNLFLVNTLSKMSKNQLKENNIPYVVFKGNDGVSIIGMITK